MSFLMKLKQPEFQLVWLLRLIGLTLLLAAPTILLPVSMMEATHQWLRVGEHFPREPITIYLARSTSALYSLHGAVIFFVSFDPRRYLKLVFLIGWLHLVLGLIVLIVDLTAPMPWYWTLIEGPPVMGGAVLLLWVTARFARSSS